jgi:minor extracellular serine protease Vpr
LKADLLINPSNITFGMLQPKSGVQTVARQLKIRNLGDQERTVHFAGKILCKTAGIDLVLPRDIKLAPGETKVISLEAQVDTDQVSQGLYTGVLTITGGNLTERLPLALLLDLKKYSRVEVLDFKEREQKNTFLLGYYLAVKADIVEIFAENISSGKKYLIFSAKNMQPGYREWVWRGLNAKGLKVPDGVYELTVKVVQANKPSWHKVYTNMATLDRTPPKLLIESIKGCTVVGYVFDRLTMVTNLQWKLSKGKIWRSIPRTAVFGGSNNNKDGKDDLGKLLELLLGKTTTADVPSQFDQFRYTIPSQLLAKGKNKILLRAEDEKGNVTEKEIEVVRS